MLNVSDKLDSRGLGFIVVVVLRFHGTVHTAQDNSVVGFRDGLLGQNLPLHLHAVLVENLGADLREAVTALHQDHFVPGWKRIVLIDPNLVRDDLLILQNFTANAGQINGHAVIGFGVELTGEDVRCVRCDVQRIQYVADRAAVGADDKDLIAVPDCDHLDSVDMDFRDPIVLLCGVGV